MSELAEHLFETRNHPVQQHARLSQRGSQSLAIFTRLHVAHRHPQSLFDRCQQILLQPLHLG